MVELLVVIGIIAVLIGILLPVLNSARRSARDVKCKSNIRQVCAALMTYAAEHKGKFPPNIDRAIPHGPFDFWCDVERMGRYLSSTKAAGGARLDYRNTILAPVLACPADDGASRSYAMNFFASSAVWVGSTVVSPDFPKAGKAWGPGAKEGSKLILVAEQHSWFPDSFGGFMCRPITPFFGVVTDVPGTRFYPGIAFVGYGFPIGTLQAGDRHFPWDTEVDWSRHRRRGDPGARATEARGRANFGFADGHVADYAPDDLADRRTRKSKLVVLWSPIDEHIERLPRF